MPEGDPLRKKVCSIAILCFVLVGCEQSRPTAKIVTKKVTAPESAKTLEAKVGPPAPSVVPPRGEPVTPAPVAVPAQPNLTPANQAPALAPSAPRVAPTQPTPVQPTPGQPTPVQPTPVQPTPVRPKAGPANPAQAPPKNDGAKKEDRAKDAKDLFDSEKASEVVDKEKALLEMVLKAIESGWRPGMPLPIPGMQPVTSSTDPVIGAIPNSPAFKRESGRVLASLPEDFLLGENGHADTVGRGTWQYLSSLKLNPSARGALAAPMAWDPTPNGRPHFEVVGFHGDHQFTAPLAIQDQRGLILVPGDGFPEYVAARWKCGETGEVVIQGCFASAKASSSDLEGDGCEVAILVDGILRFRAYLDNETRTLAKFRLEAGVSEGTNVDFVVSRDGQNVGETIQGDAARLAVRITKVSDQPKDAFPSKQQIALIEKKRPPDGKLPLPAAQQALKSTEDFDTRLAWAQDVFLRSYELFGKKDPTYDEAARAIIQDYCQMVAGLSIQFGETDHVAQMRGPKGIGPKEAQAQEQKRRFAEALSSCDDPFVMTLLAAHSVKADEPATVVEALERLEKARSGFAASKYPPEVQAIANNATILIKGALDADADETRDVVREQSDQLFRKTSEWLSRDMSTFDRRMACRHIDLMFVTNPVLESRHDVFLHELSRKGVYPWFRRYYLAKTHTELAWVERGSGTIDTVSAEDFQGFSRQLLRAAYNGIAGWEMAPEFPETPGQLIPIAMGLDRGVAGESTRFWFDQAVKADLNYPKAYHAYIYSILPRWGGSHDAIMEFGRECSQTGRFDTVAPFTLLMAIEALRDDGVPHDVILQRPSVYDEFQSLHRKLVPTNPKRAYSNMFAAAYLSAHDEDAQAIIQEAGQNIDVATVGEWGIDYTKVKAAVEDQISKPESFFALDRGDNVVAVLSPDGKTLFSSPKQAGPIRITDVATKRSKLAEMPDHIFNVTAIGMNPDQTMLVTADASGMVCVRDYPSLITRASFGIRMYPASIEYSQDGTRILFRGAPFQGNSGEGVIVDLVRGAEIFRRGDTSVHSGAQAISPDGKTYVFLTRRTSTVEVWDIDKNQRIRNLQPMESPGSVAFSTDGKWLAIGGFGKNEQGRQAPGAAIISLETGEVAKRLMASPGAGHAPQQVRFIDRNRRLVAHCNEKGIYEWLIDSESLSGSYQSYRSQANASWSEDNSCFALVDASGRVQVHRVVGEQLGVAIASPLAGTEFVNGIVSAQFSKDGRKLLLASGNSITVWDQSANQGAREFFLLKEGEMRAASFLRGGPQICVLGVEKDGTTYFAGIVEDGKLISKFVVPYPGNDPHFFSDGKKLFIGRTIVDMETRKQISVKGSSADSYIEFVKVDPNNGKQLVGQDTNGTITLFQLEIMENEAVATPITKLSVPGGRKSVEFSHDGKSLAVKTLHGPALIVDIATKKVNSLSADAVRCEFFPDGKRVAVVAGQIRHKLFVFSAQDGTKLMETSVGDGYDRCRIFISPDQSIVGVADNTVRAFNAQTGEKIIDYAPGTRD